jgi:uncharacterized protein YegP (UPF0339 family)
MKSKIGLIVIATFLSLQGCKESATNSENHNTAPSPTATRSAATPTPAVSQTPSDKWEFYKDAAGKWRWRRTAPNGKIVGSSSESYSQRSDCVDNAKRNGYTGS